MKYILLIIICLGVFFSADTIKEKAPKNINKQIKNIVEEHTPESIKNIREFFYIKENILEKQKTGKWVKINEIPLTLQQAIIAVEDIRFYQHGAFDMDGILRAMLVNIQAGEIREGGSTITQQTAKNIFLNNTQTFSRKFEEAIYAIKLENDFSKEEILEIYLNTIYFGSGAYGIKDASKTYFNKDVQQLTLSESMMLAGIPAAPSIYSPLVNHEKAKQRQAIVAEAMTRNGFVGPKQAADALKVKLF